MKAKSQSKHTGLVPCCLFVSASTTTGCPTAHLVERAPQVHKDPVLGSSQGFDSVQCLPHAPHQSPTFPLLANNQYQENGLQFLAKYWCHCEMSCDSATTNAVAPSKCNGQARPYCSDYKQSNLTKMTSASLVVIPSLRS